MLRVTARAFLFLLASVESAISLDGPRNFLVAVHTQCIHRLATKAVALCALRRPIELAMRSCQRTRRDLRVRRRRERDHRCRDEEKCASHSSRSRVTGRGREVLLHDSNAQAFEERVRRITADSNYRVVVRENRRIPLMLE